MKSISLKELTLDNLAIWPASIKWGITATICLLLFGLGYWFDTMPQLNILKTAKENELTLREEFSQKAAQAANLPAYRLQLQQIQQILSGMIQQLPNSTEIPNLLESISKIGTVNGLHFQLFNPMPEVELGDFVELPIQLTVTGNYHQLGAFVGQIAALNRIVTVEDFSIEPMQTKLAPGTKINNLNDERLSMNLTAKTYRYAEANTEKKSDKSAADKNKLPNAEKKPV